MRCNVAEGGGILWIIAGNGRKLWYMLGNITERVEMLHKDIKSGEER